MMAWVYYLLLLLLLAAGLAINLIGLPGLWVMVLAVLGYAWATGWGYVAWKTLIVLLILGLLAETVELLAGSAGAKAAGASRRGSIGAIVGAIIGAIVGSGIVLLIGTVIGAVIGAFVGAAVVELLIGKPMEQSVKAGIGAAKGRALGIAAKTLIGIVMLITALAVGFPGCGRSAPVGKSPAATAPTTQIAP